ncbi:lytic transglycosylase domain-containing protein [Catenovulum sp. SM1970]|uniref:lytic transglycosylase domain-containing protein n=1 Tax=Marinifaba aquimaris TaxID=2741323 RepID=UPI00157477FC|nr:lytic transglycosylase domain-containing protein [Marinifaba aquimaris]NTS76822.1 lytic transglycosylase domain-containing protein [Marinifaba aquimaris]
MQKALMSILAIAVYAVSSIATSAVASNDSLEKQRKLFKRAEYDAKKGRTKSYRQAVKQLGDYPLAPYVELAYLKKHPYLVNKKRIRHFLKLYTGTPLEWPLRKAWLTYLAKKGESVLFLNDYRQTENTELNCYKLRADLAIGAKFHTIADNIEALWVVGQSQPKACDVLFSRWAREGYRTTEHVKARIKLAADGGKHTLLPYLIGLLPSKDQAWGKLWHKTRRDPSYISRLSRIKKTDREHTDVLVYGLKRLIWRDPKKALATWQQAQAKFSFDQGDRFIVNRAFGIALATKGDKRALRYFEQIPRSEIDKSIAHWYLASYLHQRDWVQVARFIETLPHPLSEELIYQYWLSRAQSEMGMMQSAASKMQSIGQKRHYYGFLAAAKAGQKVNMNDIPYVTRQYVLDTLAQAPAARRAKELRELGRLTQARREWWHFKRSLTKEEEAAAALMAAEWGWHDQALRTISQAGFTDDVKIRFPLAYQKEFTRYAKRNKLPLTLAYAIARRESTFMHDASSSAGAKGLMQLMPGTAKQLAGKKISTRKLLDPSTNINLGTRYLSDLIRRFDGQKTLAIASYNAGYYRVIEWLPEEEPVDLDIWIETIPYKETREYVKSVLAYQQVYEYLLGTSTDIFSPVASGKIQLAK